MPFKTPFFIGNWKMNNNCAQTEVFCTRFKQLYLPPDVGMDVGIAPSFTSLPCLHTHLSKLRGVVFGAQNVHWLEFGAHTGEISVCMIKEFDASFAIIGHSERRQFYGENNESVSKRAKAAIQASITAIVCIGETKDEFESAKTSEVVRKQLIESLSGINQEDSKLLIIAYEPVWAIGTGLAATPEIITNVHSKIRAHLIELFDESYAVKIPILYGGSTNPANVSEIVSQANVDGALVGGASVEADSFWELIRRGRESAMKTT